MQLQMYLFAAFWILTRRCVISKTIQKRQLYREQVSPHLGGKIPDTAFHTDRLALNQLQKVGIAIPDGVILEQRNPEVYQYGHKTKRPVYKVATIKDNRFTLKEGRYQAAAASIETTYLIPQVAKEHDLINIVRPTKKQLILPHQCRKDHSRISTNNNIHQLIGHDFFQYWPYKNYKWDPNLVQVSNFYDPFASESYIGTHIFHDLTTFFDTYVHH